MSGIKLRALRAELDAANATIAQLRVELTLASKPDAYWREVAARDRRSARSALSRARAPDSNLRVMLAEAVARLEELGGAYAVLRAELDELHGMVGE